MIDILLRLPVKTIIHCERVCKKWRNLVSDSLFVNLHLSRSPTGLIIHHIHRNIYQDPGKLEWLEIQDKVDDHHLHHDPLMSLDLNLAPILQNSRIDQMGSVNGLICLWQHSPIHKFDDTYICNPVTREIMILPSPRYHRQSSAIIEYGFGVSSLTGEYKVVRTFQKEITLNGFNPESPPLIVSEAEAYTLGTGQWRSLGRLPYRLNEFYLYYGPFLNDHCHWVVDDEYEDYPEKICTFDINKETFQLFPSPPSQGREKSYIHFESLAVLKGCLCKFDAYDSECTIWVMKEYGIKKSWYKEAVITQDISGDMDWPFVEPMPLILGLKDASILLVFEGKLWEFYPRSETLEGSEMFEYHVGGVAYRPSFLKLKNFELERIHMF